MKPLRAHGVWWIIVFLYSQVVHTSMSILNCPSIQGSDQSIAAVSLTKPAESFMLKYCTYMYFRHIIVCRNISMFLLLHAIIIPPMHTFPPSS